MLNNNQKKLIPLIIKLGNIDAACKKAKVSRQTYYEWLKDEEFATELKAQQDLIYNSALIELNNLVGNAVNTYKELLNSEDESIKFRTASAILDNRLKLIDNKELQARIEALEQAVENKE